MLLVVSEPHATVVALAFDNATFAAVAIRLRYLPIRPGAAPAIRLGNETEHIETRPDLTSGEENKSP